jgi:uncharacterized protein (DUF4213/DUF364 family)
MPQAGNLEGRPISEIFKCVQDGNVLKSAIGVAALNAISQFLLESEGQISRRIRSARNPTPKYLLVRPNRWTV